MKQQITRRENFVSPYGDKSHLLRRDNTTIERMAGTLMHAEVQTPAEIDGRSLAALETVSERSTPVQRSQATAILGGVVLVAIMLMAVALRMIGASGGAVGVFFLLAVFVDIGVCLYLNAEYSPIGGERFKARTYRQIRKLEISADVEKSQMKFQAFMAVLNRTQGGDHDADN